MKGVELDNEIIRFEIIRKADRNKEHVLLYLKLGIIFRLLYIKKEEEKKKRKENRERERKWRK